MGGDPVRLMAPAWPCSGGGGRDERLPGSGGALDPHPCTKWTPIETKNQKIPGSGAANREGGRTQERRRERRRTNPAGDDRDLDAGRGRQRGGKRTQDTAADAGMQRRAQIQMAEDGRW